MGSKINQFNTVFNKKTNRLFFFNWRTESNKLRSIIYLANFLIIFLVVLVVFNAHQINLQADNSNNSQLNSSTMTDPLDQMSSANIALTVAQMTNLPETTAIANQAQSQAAEISMASTNQTVLSKPQIVQSPAKSNSDIINYVVKQNQTLSQIAHLFGVSVSSIMASNNLLTQNVDPGQNLVIPPMNGIVYTVKAGDTAQSLAKTYHSNAQEIISYNNDDATGLVPGQQIIIPNGVEPAPTPTVTYNSTPVCTDLYNASECYNGYDFGYCTWYVATQIAVPPNWGNAATWAYYAAQDGWHVSSKPVVGAIAQTPYAADGQGHVAIVRAINPNGTIWVTEMNSYGQVSPTNPTPTGGWDVLDWQKVPISLFPNYIYR